MQSDFYYRSQSRFKTLPQRKAQAMDKKLFSVLKLERINWICRAMRNKAFLGGGCIRTEGKRGLVFQINERLEMYKRDSQRSK